ncbi:hypothetical protein MKO06_04030 [Gramella sp. GC03-9]|uniref:Uncharacterized protein n=1 Tax=Christiangramia oceanisediminis TaxID=2920386 RepID=A0A9X2KW40_9FLAO|nr:hypothetical protein [Gramella oceanisediminis]MCP9199063.1 hypothetical protein [Gramella oceanisediminis]
MRLATAPARSIERDFKYAILHFLLKLFFVAGIAFLVFIITSKTYVLPLEVSPGINSIEVVDSAPPNPF